ncbi:retrovirus-related pol polyprotein from transposon TNT 1-94 [Tanacetum coccineum]
MIRRRHGKTPYEILHDKPPDLSYLHVFGALCYPTNDCENLGKLQPKADIGIFIGFAPTKKAFRIYNRRTRRIIETIHVVFDELTAMASEHSSSGPALHDMTLSLNPPPYVDLQAPEVIAPIFEVVAPEHVVLTGSPSLTTVDQDAPSPSNSHTTQETQTPIISSNVEEENHDIESRTHMGVMIRTLVEPKNYKDALTQACWIEAMAKAMMSIGVIQKTSLGWASRGYRQEEGIDFEESFGLVDPTLFIRREGKELLLVQIYVDDIIFAASTPELCDLFAKIMCSKFKMSMMEKYGFESCDPVDTPNGWRNPNWMRKRRESCRADTLFVDVLHPPLCLHPVDPVLQFAKCMSALSVHRSLYPKDSSIALTAFQNADHAGLSINTPSKHIDIRFHFIKEHVENGVIELYFVNTEYQLADIFTKAHSRERIDFLINKLCMRSLRRENLKK